MTFGLDIGATGIRCLYRAGKSLRGRRAPAWYVTLPGGQEEKQLLQRALIPFSACEGEYVVFGDNALDLSRALKLPLIPVLPNGQLPKEDPVGRQVAATLIESVLPTTKTQAARGIISVRDDGPLTRSNDLGRFTAQLLTLRGILSDRMHAGTASVLAELGDRELTGIGLCVGSTTVALSAAVHGQPLAELTVPRGCDSVDEVIARSRGRYFFDHQGNRYLDTRSVARWRESSGVDLSAPKGDDEELLRSLIREWLLAAMSEFTATLESTGAIRGGRNLSTMVITGGASRMNGFDVLVADAMRRAQLPMQVTEIRTAAESEYTIARGCLIAAELEQRVERRAVA